MRIVVVGLPGSGKSTVAKILKTKGFQIIEFSDFWKDEMTKRKIPFTDVKAGKQLSRDLRSEGGEDIFARETLKKVRKSAKNVVIMGMRTTFESKYLRSNIKDLKTIAIVTPLKVRFSRMKERKKSDDPKTLKELEWRDLLEERDYKTDKKEEKHGLLVLIKNADYMISNADSLYKLREDLEQVIDDISNI